jgi:hypothetical protein
MSVREAATYLGYVVVFTAVVAWGFLFHAPRPDATETASAHLPRIVEQGARPAHAEARPDGSMRRVTASVMK